MSSGEYLKDRIKVILLNVIALITISIFLFSVGNTFDTIITVVVTWSLVYITFLIYEYRKRKVFYENILKTVEKLDKKYLMGEIIDKPPFIDAVPYYDLIKKSGKSMLEEVNKAKTSRKEYKEYIEQWIHEVKTPISAIKLIEENNKTSTSRAVLEELENIDRYVEQALFYARSEETQKDYLIKEISLEQCVNNVIIRNKQMFILNNIDIDLTDLDKGVYCDSKWLEFIINQIIVNAVKYRKAQLPIVKIYTRDIKGGVQLIIKDNGIGIPDSEVGRVFDKGFTGSKGRKSHKSTGIGLYLCKKLCNKLGLLIAVDSKENLYTKIIITFPKGNFCRDGAI
ncbi:sensor histidine kinase [Clostridium cellulovorans]|uniref:histidine kinase n=1 Tax=Clostridium cellulovorans (strain ATCC 35296 / DSM 3052 / OCM 3 / 743B) TaxID=573061 RepID=D9SNI8_CLOC7|nr:sensor histidine kinase [Clostridium cellulovorans]ADL53980.1 integral membrane sensor signal transduction histidine kinase [Clostridium cellulovorans 743B]